MSVQEACAGLSWYCAQRCASVPLQVQSSRIRWDTDLHGPAQVFFCKYNDPIYVKLEKLDIMIALASERNIDQVLLELKEYATEVDVDFVRKVCASVLTSVPVHGRI